MLDSRATEIEQIREQRRQLEHAAEILRQSQPDTFLGRQRQPLVPLPADTIRGGTKAGWRT
jgi:hypothetical protein